MRKLVLPLAILPVLVFFSSCQKEIEGELPGGGGSGGGSGGGGSSSYYIKFKKDGADKNFTSFSMAKITDFTASGGFTGLNLIANADPTATSLEGINIGINFFNGTLPRTGTFSEEDVTMDHIVAGVYNPNSTTMVWGAGIFTPTAKPLVIKILTKTATEMTGTFEGAFYKTDLVAGTFGPEFVMLTAGEFKLKIQ